MISKDRRERCMRAEGPALIDNRQSQARLEMGEIEAGNEDAGRAKGPKTSQPERGLQPASTLEVLRPQPMLTPWKCNVEAG